MVEGQDHSAGLLSCGNGCNILLHSLIGNVKDSSRRGEANNGHGLLGARLRWLLVEDWRVMVEGRMFELVSDVWRGWMELMRACWDTCMLMRRRKCRRLLYIKKWRARPRPDIAPIP